MNVDDGEYGKLNNARTFCTPPLNEDDENMARQSTVCTKPSAL